MADFNDHLAAKAFFIQQIEDQAEREAAPLTPAEVYQLGWTETEPGFELDPELEDQLDQEISLDDYEAKIRGLVERAFARSQDQPRYQAARQALQGYDHYIVVMIDQALGPQLKPKKSWWPW